MSRPKLGKNTISFRADPEITEKFQSIVYDQFGFGGISKVFSDFMKEFVEKFDGVKNGEKLPAPSVMAEFESSLKHFIKTLDIEINPTPKKHEFVFDGPLQYFINNLEDAIIYAKALRAMRFLHNYDYQSQLETKLTLSEAVDMIINEKMETHFRERVKRV